MLGYTNLYTDNIHFTHTHTHTHRHIHTVREIVFITKRKFFVRQSHYLFIYLFIFQKKSI